MDIWHKCFTTLFIQQYLRTPIDNKNHPSLHIMPFFALNISCYIYNFSQKSINYIAIQTQASHHSYSIRKISLLESIEIGSIGLQDLLYSCSKLLNLTKVIVHFKYLVTCMFTWWKLNEFITFSINEKKIKQIAGTHHSLELSYHGFLLNCLAQSLHQR